MSKKYPTDNVIVKAIENSVKKLPFDFNEKDTLIISEWAYGLYKDGWDSCKKVLINKQK